MTVGGIRLDAAGSAVWSGLRRMRLVSTVDAVPVLMYHSISDDAETGRAPYYRLVTSPARFSAHMHWLKDHGFRAVHLAAALEAVRDGRDVSRLVVVTFDDGLRDFLTGAWPVLASLGWSASMFLPTGFIGRGRQSFKGRDCLTWAEARELHAQGVRFGSHTVTHPKLHNLHWPAIRAELAGSRDAIEQELQAPVSTFAYPYAFPQEDRAFANRFRDELVEQGYRISVTTVIGRVSRPSNPLSLPRLPVNGCDNDGLFARKLTGAYDWVSVLQRVSRQAKALRWHAAAAS